MRDKAKQEPIEEEPYQEGKKDWWCGLRKKKAIVLRLKNDSLLLLVGGYVFVFVWLINWDAVINHVHAQK